MKKEYQIEAIQHSGRKGIRYTNATNPKYDGLVGCFALFDKDDIKQFQPFQFRVSGHPYYDTWYTSEVLSLKMDERTTDLEMETVNTIYKFRALVSDEIAERENNRKLHREADRKRIEALLWPPIGRPVFM